ncbi:MAG: oligosaccharide flippase family protein [Bacteroidales bacterium]|nr:oligosaccharide flippase family protein [Bacteroidales bacterium]
MPLTKSHLRNMLTYLGASVVPMLLGLAANPWIASNMSPDDYAVSGYYTSFNNLLQPVIVFYMVHYFIKEYFRLDEEGRRRLFAVIARGLIWFSGAVSLVCFAGLLGYMHLFKSDITLPVMPYLPMAVFALPFAGLLSLIQARHRMERKAAAFFRLTVIAGTANIGLTVLFVVCAGWGAFGKLLGPLLANVGVFFYLLISYRDEICLPTPGMGLGKILRFCWPLALSAMLGYFTNGFDRSYLETLGDTTTYGNYIVAAVTAGYLTTFSTAVTNTFMPDMYESVVKRQWRRYAGFIALNLGCLAVVVGLFIALCPLVLDILTKGCYVDATPYCRIIALSTLTSAIYFIINNYTITTNRPRLYLVTSLTGSALVVAAMPAMIDSFGFYGGAWMTVLSFAGFAAVNLLLLCCVRSPAEEPISKS